tara:strand:- start:376 stop:1014 length:639 start_codon:yes stop_codon:yes gene_type:complete
MVQTGDDTLMPWAPENLGIDEINALKSNPALSGNALDPSKLVDAGMDDVKMGATYYAMPDYLEAMRINYNSAMQIAVDAYNETSATLGYGHNIDDPESIEDLVAEYDKAISDSVDTDLMISPMIDYANLRAGQATLQEEADNLREKADNLQTAREILESTTLQARDAGLIYLNNTGTEGPQADNQDFDFRQFQFDNLESDATKIQFQVGTSN